MTTTTTTATALRIAREKLDQVLALGRLRDEEARRIEAELDVKYPPRPGPLAVRTLGDPYWDALRAAPAPAEGALRTFLEGLEAEEVREIEAIMYSGREGMALDEMREYLLRSTDTRKHVCIATIIDKAPVVEYVETGLRLLDGKRPRRRARAA